ncbi:hypothetical protein [Brevundimonas sp.]|jgi:hypothetical protein|uniref:hypothetical protein n=1 Tax=Brevundimonas sp. TaxID=1871086 RepID=UPI002E124E6D|nr:hypothetical protein [Brevundimonas sp.]
MAQETLTPQSQPQPERDGMLAAQTDAGTLNSQYDDDETAGLDQTVEANRGREQGLGLGARELNAQADPGVDMAADEDEVTDVDDEDEEDDVEPLDGDVAVQGDEDEEDGAGV